MNAVRKLTLTGVLTALALALGLLERALPLTAWIPLPGVKLGLSNIVTRFALCVLGTPYAAAILLLRAVLGSVFSGYRQGNTRKCGSYHFCPRCICTEWKSACYEGWC